MARWFPSSPTLSTMLTAMLCGLTRSVNVIRARCPDADLVILGNPYTLDLIALEMGFDPSQHVGGWKILGLPVIPGDGVPVGDLYVLDRVRCPISKTRP